MNTPTPWDLKREGRFQSVQVWSSTQGGEICIAVDLHPANGELIVKAVNAHDALVEALTKAYAVLSNVNDCGATTLNTLDEARAALELAGIKLA